MATPLIRLPQEQGGTMYAFSSAARDLTRAYYNPDLVFEYSKFALLDLPVVSEPAPGSTNNYIQFDNLFDGGVPYDGNDPDDNANRHFAQTFQNYALNLEDFILNDDDFDSTLYSSDSEKILFKWLNHIGAFRVRNATSQEAATGFPRVIEENNSELTGSEYSKLVQYIGDIDVSNDKNYQGNTYNEIFINVPSSVGYTPEVLFKSSEYNTTATQYPINTNYINGRDGQTHPDPNINLDPISDNIDSTINLDVNETYNYGIDFDEAAYAKIVNDSTLNNIFDYSKRGGDFRFNAILVYYDVYSKSNGGNKSTNLYGIILLDNWKQDPGSSGWYIPEFTKYKPNDVTGLNGNAYALKLNVKFNSSLDNVGVEKNINDFSTFSMDIFFDTTSSLENASKILIEANKNYSDLVTRFEDLETLFLTQLEQEDLVSRINTLETAIENAALNFSSSSDILDMLSSTNQRLNQIINGEIPTEVQYNTDVLRAGDGIKIDKSSKNAIKVHNTNYGYSLNELYSYKIANGQIISNLNSETPFNPSYSDTDSIWTRIKKYDNLVRIYLEENAFNNNLNIYLDDSVTTFKKGQTIKFTFKTPILNLNNHKINIYTDKQNGWILKASIPSTDLLSNKPYIEMICVDEINKTFELEIIR